MRQVHRWLISVRREALRPAGGGRRLIRHVQPRAEIIPDSDFATNALSAYHYSFLLLWPQYTSLLDPSPIV